MNNKHLLLSQDKILNEYFVSRSKIVSIKGITFKDWECSLLNPL